MNPQPPAPVGVGPHPAPWPDDPRLDPELLADGDRRNVDRSLPLLDRRRRSWTTSTPAATVSTSRSRTGSTTSTSAPSCATRTRSWPAPCTSSVPTAGTGAGAMSTHRYLHIRHHPDVGRVLRPGPAAPACRSSRSTTSTAPCPSRRPHFPNDVSSSSDRRDLGSPTLRSTLPTVVCAISQYGSTRSLNAGVASGIAMYAWAVQHADRRCGG